jgi:hypothetical protein
MSDLSLELYCDLMAVIRQRFDAIHQVNSLDSNRFQNVEICAFHGRKIIEGIAFGCLVAVERGIKNIPNDAKGQWNANTILRRLRSKGLVAFPSPSIIRPATDAEKTSHDVTVTVEGQPALRLTVDELIDIYDRMHKWLHEINPYVEKGRGDFLKKHSGSLWRDLERLENFIERHTVSISGEMMFCVLRDKNDQTTKVMPLSKIASMYPRQI